MKTMPAMHTTLVACTCLLATLSSCTLLRRGPAQAQVIYALPARQPDSSPLSNTLTPIGPAIAFSRDRFVITDAQTQAVLAASAPWKKSKAKLLIVGYAQRGLPSDYARVLSHRRAESVRQILIEQGGLDAGNIHTTGYGNDMPGTDHDDSVVIYQMP